MPYTIDDVYNLISGYLGTDNLPLISDNPQYLTYTLFARAAYLDGTIDLTIDDTKTLTSTQIPIQTSQTEDDFFRGTVIFNIGGWACASLITFYKGATKFLTISPELPPSVVAILNGSDSAIKIFPSLAGPASIAVSSTVAAAVSSGSLAIEAGYTFRQTITSTLAQDLSAATKLWLAIKTTPGDSDDASLIYIEKSAGLTRVNGAPYTPTTDGSLIVTGSSGAWSVAIYIDENANGKLFGKNCGVFAGLKALIGADTVSVWEGSCKIGDGIVKAVS